MRGLALSLISLGLLAACGQNGASSGAFPSLANAHYRAEATVTTDAGTMPVVMIRDGDKMRLEFNNPQGQMAVVNGGAAGESFVLITRDGQTVAMRGMDQQVEDPAKQWGEEVGTTATRTGSCSVAGENGSEWTHTVEGGEPRVACVTDDGIILQSKEGEKVVWETTSVTRGPQDAALFALPAGVQIMDMGAMMGQLGAIAEGVQGAQQGQANPEVCNMLRNNNAPANVLAQAGCS